MARKILRLPLSCTRYVSNPPFFLRSCCASACSITFAAGHKIRVVVSSTGDPLYEANAHQDGSEMTVEPPPGGGPAVTNTLLHGGRCVSKIIAPVVPIG